MQFGGNRMNMRLKQEIGIVMIILTLSGCGGGGGDNTNFTPIKVTYLGNVNTENLSSGFAAAIRKVSEDGLIDANETVKIFKWVDSNEDLNSTGLAEYAVSVNGKKMNLQQAWNILKGYKELYYDGKEAWWNDLIDTGEFDDSSVEYLELKAIADNNDDSYAKAIGRGGKTVDDFKADKGIKTLISKETETISLTGKPVAGEPSVDVTYTDTVVTTFLDDGRTRHDLVRAYTYTSTIPTTVTTTSYLLYTYTYSDGTQQFSKGPETQTKNTTYSTETTSNEEIINTSYTDVAYAGDEEIVQPIDDIVTITNQETRTDKEYWLRLDKEYLPEEIVESQIVERTEGNQRLTIRITTLVTPEIHTHVYATDTFKITTYSDGSIIEELINQKLRFRDPIKKHPVNTQRIEEFELASEQIDDHNNADSQQDIVIIGDDDINMGMRTPGYVEDANYYQTDEFNDGRSNQLEMSSFDVAYSRGWTGLGSLIVVADSGALVNHEDLNDNIAHSLDYTGNGISNASEHGTHVAGIIAAEKNEYGMHGAAFDAKIAIAKVSDGHGYSFSNAVKAANWGKNLGAVAINVSAETRLDRAFIDSLVKDASGQWHSTHWYYGINGYNGAVDEAKKWQSALGDEMILVKAAGNAGTEYSAGMNQMAIATDNTGNLILDGQMLIVGSFDGGIHYGNKAGTVCATFANNSCQDAAKIKDFYILADGYMVNSTAANGNFVSMTGTSMAAPVVSGAIAILHQMWPHMKGKNLVQLLLVTAEKDVRDGYGQNIYSEDSHGQGMLDMDMATRPVGATGIPKTGRTTGGVTAVNGGVMVSGVTASQIQALSKVMVLDTFERDFYIDLSSSVMSVDSRSSSVAEKMGLTDYFTPHMKQNQTARIPFTINDNYQLAVGFGASEGQALGTVFKGTLGTTKSSYTIFLNHNYQSKGFFAQIGAGVTKVDYEKSASMLEKASPMLSSTATFGYEFHPKKNMTFGLSVSQPITIESAKMKYRIPVARTKEGEIIHENREINFKNDNREIDFGAYYRFSNGKITTTAFGEVRKGVKAVNKIYETRFGTKFQYHF